MRMDFARRIYQIIYGLVAIAFIHSPDRAIINFINLSTAQSIGRAKEMGVRKILGSKKTQLIFQFLTETFILTFMATLIAAFSVKPVLAIFHDYIPPQVSFNPFYLSSILLLFLFILVTTLLSGIYPAKVLSSHSPLLSLKGIGLTKANERMTLRKSLMVFPAYFIADLYYCSNCN